MANVLVIDDDEMLCKMMVQMVKETGHDVSYANTLTDGIHKINSDTYDVVMLDVQLPDGNGLAAIPQIREASPSSDIIIITGMGDPDGAELAINSGAWDYIEKPATRKQITLPLMRVIEFRERKGNHKPVLLKRDDIIGSSAKVTEALEKVAQAASINTNVLITGETGVGKELFARAIHFNSNRSKENFVTVDCAALPETLIESILFGHVKGAFSGAENAREGLIKQADGGTLFLDEIGELPLSLQKNFLRVLQERRLRPIGSANEIKSDFRLIAATNRNIDKMVEKGLFRSDLLFRLLAIAIEVPPLRERKDDIMELVLHYVKKFCDNQKLDSKGLAPDFISAINHYKWPGNVRELVNTIEAVLANAYSEQTLFVYHLPVSIRAQVAKSLVSRKKPKEMMQSSQYYFNSLDVSNFPKYDEVKQDMEHLYLKKLTNVSNGSKKEACRLSGLSRTRLFELLKKHNL